MIVCFGGGKGLSSTLRALKAKGRAFSAVVTVTDNGGSTGVLRKEFGIPAVGDFRRLVDTVSNSLFASTMESRHDGHAIGNLSILNMVRSVGFRKGLDEYRKAMGVSESIVPLHLGPCDLSATISGKKVVGEVQIDDSKGVVEELRIEPDLPVNEEVFELIEAADTTIIGPGSLYTSILPHFIKKEVAKAVAHTHVIFVMGISNEFPLVKKFHVSDYLKEIESFVKPDSVIIQSPENGVPVDVKDARLVPGDVMQNRSLHDYEKLGDVICKILK